MFGFFISFRYCSAFFDTSDLFLLGTELALLGLFSSVPIVDIGVVGRNTGVAVLDRRRLLRAID